MRRLRIGDSTVHGNAIAEMPAFDGIGRLGDESMFTELLELMVEGDRDLIEPEHQHQGRVSAAAAGTAASIYIAELASGPALRAAASSLADGLYDFAVRIQGGRRGAVHSSARRAVDSDVRDILEGFAWPEGEE